MEKLGVQQGIQHEGLRQEEARLMQKMQGIMNDNTKTASDRNQVEQELQSIRNKITELDLVQDQRGENT